VEAADGSLAALPSNSHRAREQLHSAEKECDDELVLKLSFFCTGTVFALAIQVLDSPA